MRDWESTDENSLVMQYNVQWWNTLALLRQVDMIGLGYNLNEASWNNKLTFIPKDRGNNNNAACTSTLKLRESHIVDDQFRLKEMVEFDIRGVVHKKDNYMLRCSFLIAC